MADIITQLKELAGNYDIFRPVLIDPAFAPFVKVTDWLMDFLHPAVGTSADKASTKMELRFMVIDLKINIGLMEKETRAFVVKRSEFKKW